MNRQPGLFSHFLVSADFLLNRDAPLAFLFVSLRTPASFFLLGVTTKGEMPLWNKTTEKPIQTKEERQYTIPERKIAKACKLNSRQ